MRYPLLVILVMTFLMSVVSAATEYTTMANLITFKTPLGLLIPLGIENFVPTADAIMYYNYIAVGAILLVASFAGQANESRFAFFVPVFAALMVFIGWLQAPDPTTQWGMIIGCIFLGALMYMNDMNHEKYGLPGPGSKLLTVVFMIIVFQASVTLVSTNGMNLMPEIGNSGMSQSSLLCGDQTTGGYGYQCDANGNMMFDSSVKSISNIGGSGLDIVSIGLWALQAMVGAIIFLLKIVAAVLVFSVVLYAAYPALAASPQAVLLLGFMQLIIWGIYAVYFFNIFYKPSFETSGV
jgi:hypothetical protein